MNVSAATTPEIAFLERVRAVLELCEWADEGYHEDCDEGACPVCDHFGCEGHKPDCELAAVLSALRTTATT